MKLLTSIDFIASDWPELLCDDLPDDKQAFAHVAICHVDFAAKQVEEMIRLFPANREKYIRIHNRAARRIMRRMEEDCGLIRCTRCKKYFYQNRSTHEYCEECGQDLREHNQPFGVACYELKRRKC